MLRVRPILLYSVYTLFTKNRTLPNYEKGLYLQCKFYQHCFVRSSNVDWKWSLYSTMVFFSLRARLWRIYRWCADSGKKKDTIWLLLKLNIGNYFSCWGFFSRRGDGNVCSSVIDGCSFEFGCGKFFIWEIGLGLVKNFSNFGRGRGRGMLK